MCFPDSTSEGSAQIANRLQNLRSRDIILPIPVKKNLKSDTHNVEHPAEEIDNNLDDRSLHKYLTVGNEAKKDIKFDEAPKESVGAGREYFSAENRRQRMTQKERHEQIEKSDINSRAAKVRINSLIAQTKGNLKPLQV